MITAAANAGVRPEVCRDFLKVRDARLDRPVPPAADPEISRPPSPRGRRASERALMPEAPPVRVGGWLSIEAAD